MHIAESLLTLNSRVLVRDGDIFTVDSPKAYAPLGYGAPTDPIVVRPEDFKNDIPLPSYGMFKFYDVCWSI